MSIHFKIKEGTISEVVALMKKLKEFHLPIKTEEEILQKINKTKHQIAIAFEKDSPIGFKLSYGIENEILYSWLGGVLKPYRNIGVARQLAKHQEKWAKENSYTKIRFKTLNKHKAMLIFALKNGFEIKAMEVGKENDKIILEKVLT